MAKKGYAIGYCSRCHEHTAFKLEDYSFSFEYGSIKGVQRDYQWISECCEAPPEGEVDEPEPDYPDLWEREYNRRFQ